MRVIVLGGTRFIGLAITGALAAAGHAVLVAHRGITEPAGLRGVEHLHAAREAWASRRAAFDAFAADAAVDVSAGNGPDARAALAALPPGIQLVALSSIDVYRAYEALHGGRQTDPVPLTEESPTSAGSSRHCAGSGPAAPGCPSGQAVSWGAGSTPATSPGRCSAPWAAAGPPGSA